jgi:hypothetical protein
MTNRSRGKELESFRCSVCLAGYITAYDEWSAGPSDITRDTDFNGVLAWIDDYCAKNPLETIATAASDLVVTLLMRGKWSEEAATPSSR